MTLVVRIVSAVVLFALVSPGAAFAHPLVDEAVEAANDGRFEDALASFDQAFRATDLSRADLIQLLEQRAIVRSALRASADLDADLRLLAAIAPEHQLGQVVPPQVRRRFEQIRAEPRAAPSLAVSVEFTASGVVFTSTPSGIAGALLQSVRVYARSGRGAWLSGEGTTVELPLVSAQSVEWYAEVRGPGGVVLLREGEESAPRHTLNPLAISVARAEPDSAPTDDTPSRSGLWWAVGGGTAAAIVLATVIVVVVRDPEASTYVTDPVFR